MILDARSAAYLKVLGVRDPGPPTLDALVALHRAHVQRIPYEALDIQMRRPTSVYPDEVISRILRRRGGYCVQLNSAFGTLLSTLGYSVTWHRAGVQTRAGSPPPGAEHAPHLTLVVRLAGQDWLVDVGLGDGLIEPLPLRAGTYPQAPLTFRLAGSQVEAGGWRLDHDPRGSVAGMDVAMAPAGVEEFARWHPYLATSDVSRLVRTVVVMRRDGTGADTLTGCVLARVDVRGRHQRELVNQQDWFAALADVFGLSLDEVPAGDRLALWERVWTAHQQWLARRASPPVPDRR